MQRPLPITKRTPQSSCGDDDLSCSSMRDDNEKTIPFLRQLTDMLQNNDELISFVPGLRTPTETVHGKIIVHDRNRVQSEVLPVYFNHASFASLRRQLSYFSFVRVGKSRQSDAAYVNRSVVELSDILRLKRRPGLRRASSAGVMQGQSTDPRSIPAVTSRPQKSETMDQREDQPRQHLRHMSNISVDVASAVLSGTLHAVKTNHDLDVNNGGGGTTTAMTKSDSPGQRRSTATSFADSSMSQSSDNDVSKDAASNKDCGVNDYDDRPEEKTTEKKSKAYNERRHRQRTAPSSMAKHTVPRKDRARFQRMLSVNAIVPFIHLPAGHGSRRKKKSMVVIHDPICGGGGGGCTGMDDSAAKENMTLMIDRATSDAAINALLALGSDCQ